MSQFPPTPSSGTKWLRRLYIDQPIGAGFSYGSITISTSEEGAVDVWKFLQIWFSDSRFNKYASRDFGIWTESYGGHYGPMMAACVPPKSRTVIPGIHCERLQIFFGEERCDLPRKDYGHTY
jgi:hypothetical protein